MAKHSRSTPSPPTGTQGGITDLFLVERAPMVRMATLLVGSVSIAEEVVQDAFASVGERWDQIERPGAYLRTSVVNGCAGVLRRRSIRDRHRRAAPEPARTEIPTRLIELRDALNRLTDRQRIVIVLRYFVDIPDDEIAELLEAQPGTIRSLAHRALAVLREELS